MSLLILRPRKAKKKFWPLVITTTSYGLRKNFFIKEKKNEIHEVPVYLITFQNIFTKKSWKTSFVFCQLTQQSWSRIWISWKTCRKEKKMSRSRRFFDGKHASREKCLWKIFLKHFDHIILSKLFIININRNYFWSRI